MKITKEQLRRIIKENLNSEGRVLKEYSEYASWQDLSDQMDDITEMIDMLVDKYILSKWIFEDLNKGNAISGEIAKRLEQLYRDSERLGSLINSRGELK